MWYTLLPSLLPWGHILTNFVYLGTPSITVLRHLNQSSTRNISLFVLLMLSMYFSLCFPLALFSSTISVKTMLATLFFSQNVSQELHLFSPHNINYLSPTIHLFSSSCSPSTEPSLFSSIIPSFTPPPRTALSTIRISL